MTPEQKEKYLSQKGVRCPYCQCEQVEGGSFDVEAGCCSQYITCLECLAEWTDIYTLSDVEESYPPAIEEET